MALIVSTWIWGRKYGPHYLAALRRGLAQHLAQPFTFVCYQPPNADNELLAGCFCRLRMFAPEWQDYRGLRPGDRLVCLDLDIVITGPLDPLFDRPEPFVILSGANAANPCPFNGSVMMLRVGEHAEVWRKFSLSAASKIPFYEFPDDQGWIHYMLPGAATWKVGPSSGIYAFRKPGWNPRDDLPGDARMVVFPGHRDPSQFASIPWIAKHWL